MDINDLAQLVTEREQRKQQNPEAATILGSPGGQAAAQPQTPTQTPLDESNLLSVLASVDNRSAAREQEVARRAQVVADTPMVTKVADTFRSFGAGAGELATQAGQAVDMLGRTDMAKNAVMAMPEAVAGMDSDTYDRVNEAVSAVKPGQSLFQEPAKTLKEIGKTTSEYWDSGMSEGGQILSQGAWQDAPGIKGKVHAAVLGAARSAPQTVGIGMVGKALTGLVPVAMAIPTVAKGLTRIGLPAQMSKKAAEWMATGAVYGGVEGVSAGLSNAAQVGEDIDKMDVAVLQENSPKFNEYLAQTDATLPPEQRALAAKAMLKEDAENMALWATAGLSTVTGSLAGAGIFDKVLSSKRFLIDRVLGGLKEAHQEFWQSGLGEKLPANLAMQQADPSIGAMDNVWHEGVAGAGPGAIMGLVAGGGGGKKGLAPDEADPGKTPFDRNKVAADIERMNLPTRDLIAIRNGEFDKVPYAAELLQNTGLTTAHIDNILDNRANEMNSARAILEQDVKQGPLVRAATMATIGAEDALIRDKARREQQQLSDKETSRLLYETYDPSAPGAVPVNPWDDATERKTLRQEAGQLLTAGPGVDTIIEQAEQGAEDRSFSKIEQDADLYRKQQNVKGQVAETSAGFDAQFGEDFADNLIGKTAAAVDRLSSVQEAPEQQTAAGRDETPSAPASTDPKTAAIDRLMTAHELDISTPAERADMFGRSSEPLTSDNAREAEWTRQKNTALADNRAKNTSKAHAQALSEDAQRAVDKQGKIDPAMKGILARREKRQQEMQAERQSAEESLAAIGTVPKSEGNITAEDAAKFEQKVIAYRQRQKERAAVRQYAQQKKEDERVLTDAKVPKEIKAEALRQAKEIVKADPVYGHMEEARKRGGINLEAFKQDYDTISVGLIGRRYPGIFSRVGTQNPDEFAQEMGYEDLKAMISRFSEARTQQESVAQIVREKMDEWQRAEAEQQAAITKEQRGQVMEWNKAPYSDKQTTGAVFPAPEEAVAGMEALIRRHPEVFKEEDLEHWTYTSDQQARLKNAHREATTGTSDSLSAENETQTDLPVTGETQETSTPDAETSTPDAETSTPEGVGEIGRSKDLFGESNEPAIRQTETAQEFLTRREVERPQRIHWMGLSQAGVEPKESSKQFATRTRKEIDAEQPTDAEVKAESSTLINRIAMGLGFHEPCLRLAELKDKQGYLSTAQDYVVEWVKDIIDVARHGAHKAHVRALELLVVDGKPVLPEGFFTQAYNSALAKVKQEATERGLRRSAERLESTIADMGYVGDAADNFREGWNHAISGKSRSSLRLNEFITKGYDAAAEFMKTPEGKGLFKKEKAKKLENTGADLIRAMDKKRGEVSANDDTKTIVKKILAASNRGDMFKNMASKEATPGAQKLVAMFRDFFPTFGDFMQRRGQLLYSYGGKYLGRRPNAEVILGAYIDGTIYRYDTNGKHVDETKEQRVHELVQLSHDYIKGMSEVLGGIQGETVKELAIAITDNIMDYSKEFPGQKASLVAEPKYSASANIRAIAAEYIYDRSGFARNLILQVNESGDVVQSGHALDFLLRKENDESLKRKGGAPLLPPKFDRVTRHGVKDHRKGRNITPQEFKEHFGFVDIGFGEYVQVQEDQDHLNYAYDSFMDLAELLGVPPKAMSVSGELYFSIGNLGHGKAAAHYNRAHPHPKGGTVAVINVTNTKGDGTVSHEWAHAFDITTPNMRYAFDKSVAAMRKTMDWARIEQMVRNMLKGSSYWTDQKKTATKQDRIDNALRVWTYASRKQKSTKYYTDALALDGVKSETSKPYWSNDEELLARAFEAWVADKLEAAGGMNTYLVNPKWVGEGNITPEKGYRGTPYPAGEERKLFARFFDAMVESLVVNQETGEITLDKEKFDEKAPNLQRENMNRWKEIEDQIEQWADEIERDEMNERRDQQQREEMTRSMKPGDIVEPRDSTSGFGERHKVTFPAVVVAVSDVSDNGNVWGRRVTFLSSDGAEVRDYASSYMITTKAEDVEKPTDKQDLPNETPEASSGELTQAEIEALFDEVVAEMEEANNEQPDAPQPGEGVASDLKLTWTREDISELRDLVANGKIILVGDKDLGIPTIHDFPSGHTKHHGFGAFTTTTPEYEAHWDGGGMMIKTAGGRSYTIVDLRKGTLPFYDKQAVLDTLGALLGEKKPQTGEVAAAKIKRDFDALMAGKAVEQYTIEEVTRPAKQGGKTWIYKSGDWRNFPADGVVQDKVTAAAMALLELDYLVDEINTVVNRFLQQQQATKTPPPSLSSEQEKTVKELAQEAAKLGVEGIDDVLSGLVKLFGGGKSTLMSFPAGFNEETYAEAKPLFKAALVKFQASGRTLKDLFRLLINKFGQGIKPYAVQFTMDEGLTENLGSKTSASKQVAQFVADRLNAGKEISWQELFAESDKAWQGTQADNTYTSRDAYDAMEMGVNLWIRQQDHLTLNHDAQFATSVVKGLTRIMHLLPTQTKRTKEQVEFQQFSTPPSLAYVANWVANVGVGDVMMEPSAGTGDLAIWSEGAGATLILNELSSRRAGLLRELFPQATVYTEDGLQLNNILPKEIRASVVVMNPPFSSTAGRTNTNDTMNGAKHLEQALKRLAPGGRLVAIVGEGMGASKPAFKAWWDKIKAQYNVKANISINGAQYAKYGTTFDNQIIVIDNTGKTTTDPVTVRAETIEELPQILQEIRNEREQAQGQLTPPQRDREEDDQEGQDTRPGDDANLDADAGGAGEGDGTSTGMGGSGELPGSVRNPGGGGSRPGSTGTGGSSGAGGGRGGRGGGGSGAGSTQGNGTGGSGSDATGGTEVGDGTSPPEISGLDDVESVEQKREGELTDSIFEPYVPQRLVIPGAKEHPGALVQSAAMASVLPPEPTYTPNLPKEVITKGLLSLVQLEAVVYAGQAHGELLPNGKRRGFFIGDNTGVGKGREISGIIMDNMRQGRKKAIWISKSAGLIKDAREHFEGAGGNNKLIFSKTSKTTDKITQKEGILFITYDSLKTPEKQKGTDTVRSRLDQILEWLGDDFDGVIAFDEAHAMGNATAISGVRGASKPSQNALTGVDLQNKTPNARIVYVSATGATEVKNLSYATRLGLWGENTPFSDVVSFINRIVMGGVAAMEMVARDMKALGSYIARSLSFDGVKYRTITYNLSKLNVAKYDELARMWQVVLQNIDQALDDTNSRNSSAKRNAMTAFWGAQQRFFNQVITAMQTPAMIADAKKQLEDGNSVVVQLTNHYSGQADREVAKAREEGRDLEELDLTPRQMLEQFLINSFPTKQYEDQLDDAGNIIQVPVRDADGNAVHNADAVAARDALLATLRQISIPGNPIDTILEELGKHNVAEVTGRNRRYLTEKDGKGGYKVVEEKRSESARDEEVKDFKAGKRRVLIFSGAGATGYSFHADNTTGNTQQRIHYVLQPGWRADTAVQGFGRTHRTNQKSAPEYVLVTTDVQAQKRFVSSIARRLDQLGALTKGQRETSSGIFNASDNLESKYGTAALLAFFTNLANGYTTMSFDEVTHEMGLTNLKGEQGQLIPNNIPEMTKFLNRLLSLTIDRQNEVFSTFYQYLDEIVARAVENGTYDTGLQTVKAASIKKVRDEVVYTDERTKAKTRFIEVSVSNPVAFQTFDEAKRWADSRGANFAGWYSGPRSKIFGLVDLGERVDKDGRTFRRGETRNIIAFHNRHVDNVIAIRRQANGYKKFATEEEARAAWEQATIEHPPTVTRKDHMLVGVLLPIWDRIEGNPRIFRMQTDNGEVLLGRLLTGEALDKTMRNLGIGNNFTDVTPQDFIDRVQAGATLVLANGWNIKRKYVSGQWRFEIYKGGDRSFSESEVSILVGKGAFHEIISWKDRVFIPQGDKAASVLANITKATPVVDVEGGADSTNNSMLSKAQPVPQGKRADIEQELTASVGGARLLRMLTSGKVVIADSQEAIKAIIEKADSNGSVKYSKDGSVQGAYVRGTVYLVRDGIEKGQAFPVLLHELGEHAAQLGFTNESDYKAILASLERRKDRQGVVGDAIRAAMARVPEATKPEHYWSEVAAYLIENEANTKIPIFDKVFNFFKNLLYRAGLISVDNINHKDLVLFARAAVIAASGGNAVQSSKLSVREATLRKYATWDKKRIRNELDYAGYNDGRTKAHVAFVTPEEFVRATTPDKEAYDRIFQEAGELDIEKLTKETQSPYLNIRDGRIEGHEGRHRMAAMAMAGIKEVPVALDYGRGEQREEQTVIALGGQRFSTGSGSIMYATEAIPLTFDNRAKIEARMADGDVRFSRGMVQTATDAFKRWFGDSKITKDGKPHVLYHGTQHPQFLKDQEYPWVFDQNRPRNQASSDFAGLGIFLGDSTIAGAHAGWEGTVHPFYVKMENPYRVTSRELAKKLETSDAASLRKRLQELSGHDGILITDRGHAVVFEANQIKSATDNTGAFSEANNDVRYSIASQTAETIGAKRMEAINAIVDGGYKAGLEQQYFQEMLKEGEDVVDVDDVELRKKAWDWFSTLPKAIGRKMLGAMTLRQLRDVFANNLPEMETFYQTTREMDATSKAVMGKADEIYNKWARLPKQDAKDMSELMIKATVLGINPENKDFEPRANSKALRVRIDELARRVEEIDKQLGWGSDHDEALRATKQRYESEMKNKADAIEEEMKRYREYHDLHTRYKALSNDAKEVYQAVKQQYTNNLDDLFEALKARIERQIGDKELKKQTILQIREKYDKYLSQGPYFPLSRFGEFLSVAEKNGRREVRTFDTMAERTRYMRRRKREGWDVQTKTKREYTRETAGVSSKFVEDLFVVLDKTDTLSPMQREGLKDEVNQMFIKALPDLSHRKHFAHRQNVEGYSRDQMRAFASNMQHAAHHIARIKHADKLEAAVNSLLEKSRALKANEEGDDITDLYNELNARLKVMNNPEVSWVSQSLTSFGFVMNIGPSIASAVVNMSQTPLVAFPVLATRFKKTGTVSAMQALTKAGTDYFTSKPRWESGPSYLDNPKIPQAEKDMITSLIADGTIDVTAAHSLAQAAGEDFLNMARTKHGHAAMKVMRAVSYPFHIAELANRKITAMAAYRLALKNGFTHEEAINEAREAVLESHFDYSQANRARWMQGNTRRVLLLFKQYSQQMTWLLGRSFHQMIKGESKEIKQMAAKRLGMILFGHFIVAGANGMPVLGGLAAVAQFLFSAFGDDDEPVDIEVALRNMMADNLGDKWGEAIAKGPWRMIPGLGDLDLAGRVSLGDLWFRAPEQDAEGKDKFNQYLNLLMGPVATNVANVFVGAHSISDGNTYRGVETMMPKAIKDGMKAFRMAREGVKTLQEDTLIQEVSIAEIAGQALGFSPAKMSEMYEGSNAIKGYQSKVDNRRQKLINRWVQATRKGDSQQATEAMREISIFNSKQNEFGISGKTLKSAMQARFRVQANTKDGVYLPQKRATLREHGRFANVD
jgi:predicted RNA methylase